MWRYREIFDKGIPNVPYLELLMDGSAELVDSSKMCTQSVLLVFAPVCHQELGSSFKSTRNDLDLLGLGRREDQHKEEDNGI